MNEKKKAGVCGGVALAIGSGLISFNYFKYRKNREKELAELKKKLDLCIKKILKLKADIKRFVRKGDAEELLKAHRSLVYYKRKYYNLKKRIKSYDEV